MDKKDIKSLTFEELSNDIKEMGEPAFRAKQIFDWLHVKLVRDFSEMTNISEKLRTKLAEKYELVCVEEVERLESKEDGTIKFLFRLKDRGVKLKNNVIETVFMRYNHGNSVCISSQLGCRMGCRFCASTIGGLERNLEPSEMLDQIYQCVRLTGERVSNIVIMGTGEPLDNYDNVVRFIRMISCEEGYNISQRNITLSTCGIVENIYKLADEKLVITLALSLHAPDDETRQKLMPVANKYLLSEVIEAMDCYYDKTGRRNSYEYSVVAGVNDSPECAHKIVSLLKGKNCHVNLIPVNPIKEREYRAGSLENIQNFKNILEKNRITVTIRKRKGSDIDAACGQLRKSHAEKNA